MKAAMEEDKGIVGTFYKSCMNEEAIKKLGNLPLQPMLKRVEEVKDMKSLTAMLVWMGNRDNGALFGWGVSPDSQSPTTRAFYLSPGGMTLPDQSYYLKNDDDMKAHRAIEKDIIEKLLINAGVDKEQARKDALNCLAIETRTAEITMKREEARSAVGTRIMREDLKKMIPLMHWDDFFEGIGMHDVGLEGGPQLIMRDDKFFHRFDRILTNPNPEFAKLSSLVGSDSAWEVAGLEYEPAAKPDGVFDEADAEVIKSYPCYTLVSSYEMYVCMYVCIHTHTHTHTQTGDQKLPALYARVILCHLPPS
jgi:predicted metalloendopeptidase